MAPEQKLRFVIEVDQGSSQARIRAFGSEVKGLDAAGRQAETGLSQARRGVQSISQSLDELKQAAVGLFALNEIRAAGASFLTAADSMTALNAKLGIASRTTADYAAAQQQVAATALESHQSLEAVGQLYARIGIATKNTAISQADLADTTRAVALATSLSNTTAQEAAAGMLQFSQAMGSGRMQGDELRSVMENMPLVASALVDAVGGDMARFRKMAEEGLITTEWMVEVLKAKMPEFAAIQAGMPITVGKAVTDLQSKAKLYIGEMDAAHDISLKVGGAVAWLGDNLDTLARGGVATLTVALSVLSGRGLVSLAVMTPQAVAALTRLATTTQITTVATAEYAAVLTTTSRASAAGLAAGLAGLINPITAITTVLGLGAAAWIMWGDKAESAADRAKKAAAEAARDLRLKLALANPEFEVDEARAQVEAQKRVVADKEAEWRRIGRTSIQYSRQEPDWLSGERKALDDYEAAYRDRLRSLEETKKQLAGREVAAEVRLSDFIKDQERGREMATADHLKRQLLQIGKAREEELLLARKKFKDAGELAAAEAAVNTRFRAEEAKARKDAGKKAATHAESLPAAMRGWEGKADLAGLAGVEEQLAKIGQEAAELRRKFGDQGWIDAGQAKAENAAIQADLQKTTEQMAEARRVWEEKTNLAGLTELDRKLKDIGQEADELRRKFGNQEWIDTGQAEAENGSIQLDLKKRLTNEQQELLKVTKEYHEAQLSGLPEEAAAIARLSDQYDGSRQAVVTWGEAQITAGRDTAAVMAEVFSALDALDARQIESIEKIKNKNSALTEFQIQAFRNIQDAGANMFESLRTGGDNFLQNFTQMTLKMVDQWASAQMMIGLFGEEFGKGGKLGGWLGTAASAIIGAAWGGSGGGIDYSQAGTAVAGTYYGGGRADGGPVSAGKMYEVNERGIPELLITGGKQYLMMGPTGGAVVPSTLSTPSTPSTSTSTPISVTIIAADAQSLTDMMRRNPQAILGPLREALRGGDRGLRSDLQGVMA